jgi:hypothetical protein
LYSKAVEQQRSVALERKYSSTSAKEKGSEPSELETFITPRELRISTTEHRKRDHFANYGGIPQCGLLCLEPPASVNDRALPFRSICDQLVISAS